MRIRDVLVKLRNQGDSTNRAVLDRFLACLNPVMSHPDRMPMTPSRVVTTPNRAAIIRNHIGNAIINYGHMVRGEQETGPTDTVDLEMLEKVAAAGFQTYVAVPKEPNSAIYVLRTIQEHRLKSAAWSEAKEKALLRKVESQLRGAETEL